MQSIGDENMPEICSKMLGMVPNKKNRSRVGSRVCALPSTRNPFKSTILTTNAFENRFIFSFTDSMLAHMFAFLFSFFAFSRSLYFFFYFTAFPQSVCIIHSCMNGKTISNTVQNANTAAEAPEAISFWTDLRVFKTRTVYFFDNSLSIYIDFWQHFNETPFLSNSYRFLPYCFFPVSSHQHFIGRSSKVSRQFIK